METLAGGAAPFFFIRSLKLGSGLLAVWRIFSRARSSCARLAAASCSSCARRAAAFSCSRFSALSFSFSLSLSLCSPDLVSLSVPVDSWRFSTSFELRLSLSFPSLSRLILLAAFASLSGITTFCFSPLPSV